MDYITGYSLAYLLVPAYVVAVVGVVVASILRRAPMLHRDLLNPRAALIHFTPFVALFVVALFTPAAPALIFWFGAVVLVIAGVIMTLSLVAFIRGGAGLATGGIYKVSRNPIYVGLTLAFLAFTLMAWSASWVMGLLALLVTYTLVVGNHVVIRGEEAFLEAKYGDAYRAYKARVPRYFWFF